MIHTSQFTLIDSLGAHDTKQGGGRLAEKGAGRREVSSREEGDGPKKAGRREVRSRDEGDWRKK